MATAHRCERLQKGFARSSMARQQLARRIFCTRCDRQQNVFGGNIFVLKFFRLVEGRLQNLVRRITQMLLRNAAHLWEPRNLRVDFPFEGFRTHTKAV